MKIFKNTIMLLALTILFPQITFCQSSIEKVIPENWKIFKTIIVPQEKISLFNKEMGAEALTITNYLVEVGSSGIQINIVHCKTENDADILYKKLVEMHNSEEHLLKTGKVVYEFRSPENKLIQKAKSIFKIE